MPDYSTLITQKISEYEQTARQDTNQLRVGVVGAFRRGKSMLIATLPQLAQIELIEFPGYGGLDTPPIEQHRALWEALPSCDLILFVFLADVLPMRADEVVLKWLSESGLPIIFVQTDHAEPNEWSSRVAPHPIHNRENLKMALLNLDVQSTRLQPQRAAIEALFQTANEELDRVASENARIVEQKMVQFMETFRAIMARRVNASQPHELAARDSLQITHTLLNEAASTIVDEFRAQFEGFLAIPAPELPPPPGMIAVRVQSKGSEIAAFVAQATKLAERYQPAIYKLLQEYASQIEARLQEERERLNELQNRWHYLA